MLNTIRGLDTLGGDLRNGLRNEFSILTAECLEVSVPRSRSTTAHGKILWHYPFGDLGMTGELGSHVFFRILTDLSVLGALLNC